MRLPARPHPWRHVLSPLVPVALAALLALAAVYAYAAAALAFHARLARLAPPRTLLGAVAMGLLTPACGCTALAYARRAPAPLRASYLAAAYAGSPLLVVAAGLLAGPLAAAGVAVLAALVALAAVAIPAGEKPRTRLDDLLLRRDANPLRDAAPYTLRFGAPALAVGALVGGASLAPPWAAGLAAFALAALLGAPAADVALDHGAPFARRLTAHHLAFSALAGLTIGLLAWSAPA